MCCFAVRLATTWDKCILIFLSLNVFSRFLKVMNFPKGKLAAADGNSLQPREHSAATECISTITCFPTAAAAAAFVPVCMWLGDNIVPLSRDLVSVSSGTSNNCSQGLPKIPEDS